MNKQYELNRKLREDRLKRLSEFVDVEKQALFAFFNKYPNEALENNEIMNLISTAIKELVFEHKLVELDDDVNECSLFTHPNNSIWGGK